MGRLLGTRKGWGHGVVRFDRCAAGRECAQSGLSTTASRLAVSLFLSTKGESSMLVTSSGAHIENQEVLADLFQAMRLWEDALLQYDELEASFFQALKGQRHC